MPITEWIFLAARVWLDHLPCTLVACLAWMAWQHYQQSH